MDRKLRIFDDLEGRTYRSGDYRDGIIPTHDSVFLYAIIRKLKPNTVIETGVCNGYSSAVLLLALSMNKRGRLYSIDFPEHADVEYEEGTFWNGKGGDVIPEGKECGWLVPDNLKDRWELILGRSQDKLPGLLDTLDSVDVFMHDSEHSYECMWFEYNCAWEKLIKGGFLASHDISYNSSFHDFARRKDKRPFFISGNFAFLVRYLRD
ncbi:MAG: class I SAM-dependent methyltransferase [Methanobacteriota archaeon]|nr:MAG: class I SAM-dependent methyltransferase [Euryarchaeota archaeon]